MLRAGVILVCMLIQQIMHMMCVLCAHIACATAWKRHCLCHEQTGPRGLRLPEPVACSTAALCLPSDLNACQWRCAAATPAQECDPVDCIKCLSANAHKHISTVVLHKNIINGLGTGAVGGGGNPSLVSSMTTCVFPGPVDSASAPPSSGRGNYLPTQSQALYHSASSSPSRLVIPPLALSVSTRNA